MSFKSLTFLNKSLHLFENVFARNLSKCPTIMKKASIYLEIILKTSSSLKKPHITLKKPQFPWKLLQNLSKNLISYKSLYFSENVFKKPRNFYKSLTLIIKRLHFYENVFKKLQNRSKRLTLLKKASISL
jgi:hypothetical protein